MIFENTNNTTIDYATLKLKYVWINCCGEAEVRPALNLE